MARNVIAPVFLFLGLVCLLQATSAFDLAKYITGRLQNTIEQEHITCSNYKQFCEKSNDEVKVDGKSQDAETVKMAVNFCKAILRIHVCDIDLGKGTTFDED